MRVAGAGAARAALAVARRGADGCCAAGPAPSRGGGQVGSGRGPDSALRGSLAVEAHVTDPVAEALHRSAPSRVPRRRVAGDRGRAVCGPWLAVRARRVRRRGGCRSSASVSAASAQAGRVPAIGCIVGTHAAELSSPALRVAARVLSDQGLTAPHAGAGSRLVRHTTRPEQRGKEDTMNRWTGTGHLTKDPKFLETENGTAICTLRIAVKRAGKQGHDGYFDVKCFDAQAIGVRAVPQGRARDRRRRPPAVRRVPDPGRQLRLPDLHRRRARRVPRQPQAAPTVRPATRPPPTSPPRTARRARPTRPPDHHRGPAAQHRPRARRLPR